MTLLDILSNVFFDVMFGIQTIITILLFVALVYEVVCVVCDELDRFDDNL